jgi:hypothetical protein
VLAAGCESDCFLLRLMEVTEIARGAHPNLDGVGFKVVVLRLTRIGSYRDRLVVDILYLIDVARLGERAAGGIVKDKLDFGTGLPWRMISGY